MQSILITGAASGVGKTTAAAYLLKHLPQWGAVKLTVTREEKDFCLVTDQQEIIGQSGKDTAVLQKAGAAKVIWIKASPSWVEKGISQALALLTELPGVIWEGNSLLEYLKPDAIIFVTDGRKETKPSGEKAARQADYIFSNQRDSEDKWLQLWEFIQQALREKKL